MVEAVTDDDLGKKVKIEVSFADDFGSDEQRTSAPTDTVTAVAMTTLGVTVSTTALTVTEEDTTGDSYTVVLNTQPTANVTVTVAGHAGTDVTPSPTSLTFTTTTWGTAQTVTVTAGDDADTANDAVSLTHSAASTDTGYEGISIDGVAVTVNDNDTAPATGAPIITGTAEVGQTLTAVTTGIADADGLTSVSYAYQWIRVDGTEADIAGENLITYTLVDADLGKTLKVRVSFDDDASNSETLTSAATATVVAAATAPTVSNVAVTSTPASGTSYYLAGEVIEFTVTFSAPVTVTATPKFAFRLGAATRQAAYASGSDSAALVFARTVQAGEVDRNGISWNAVALALDGGTITQTGATTAARLTHAAQASLEGHRVDAAPPNAGLGVGAGAVAGAGLRRAARSGLDAGDGRVYGDGDGRSHHHDPGGVGGVDIRHLGDADTGRGAGCGRDGDAGVRAAGVEPGAGRGGQRCAGVQRPGGQGRGGQHRRDGRADHHGHGRGGRDADGGHHGHCRRRRADQPHLHVPVDSGETARRPTLRARIRPPTPWSTPTWARPSRCG